MIIGIELEERLPPVMGSIRFSEVIIGQDADVFCALKVTVLMTVMYDFMAPVGHHLAKFDHLLRVGTGIKLFGRDCVW
jgi:hypothetical protein